jgi:hypothetical protein
VTPEGTTDGGSGWTTIAVFGVLGVLIALGTLVAAPRPYRSPGQIAAAASMHAPDTALLQRLRAPINTPGTVVVRSLTPHLLAVEATSAHRGAAVTLANEMTYRLVRFMRAGERRARFQARVIQNPTVSARTELDVAMGRAGRRPADRRSHLVRPVAAHQARRHDPGIPRSVTYSARATNS